MGEVVVLEWAGPRLALDSKRRVSHFDEGTQTKWMARYWEAKRLLHSATRPMLIRQNELREFIGRQAGRARAQKVHNK